VIGRKRFIDCDGVLVGSLAHPCSLLCCAGNQASTTTTTFIIHTEIITLHLFGRLISVLVEYSTKTTTTNGQWTMENKKQKPHK